MSWLNRASEPKKQKEQQHKRQNHRWSSVLDRVKAAGNVFCETNMDCNLKDNRTAAYFTSSRKILFVYESFKKSKKSRTFWIMSLVDKKHCSSTPPVERSGSTTKMSFVQTHFCLWTVYRTTFKCKEVTDSQHSHVKASLPVVFPAAGGCC